MSSPIDVPRSSTDQHADKPAGTRRRLILCYDGTWNRRDSGTNVYHLSNLIREGEVVDSKGTRWTQKIKYDEGVGTGMLDSVSGGAFGSGLSVNVREGYDWLVENYHGTDDPKDADEIYIFGFSRGAFTARSLVGLIQKCGLLFRGAPVSLEQLWEGYQILGRYPSARIGGEPEKNWWERIVGLPKRPFRELWEVKLDSWESGSRSPDRPKNRSEELLRQWSRRVPITCLGVFDTVGSMGLDALAIPWLRTKMAKFHDTSLSSIIVNGFQALAIDEHRANFVHVPWHGEAVSEAVNGIASPITFLGGRIEQRWFAGAHSNIGGGYENDVLAHFPLEWMMSQCESLGLVFRPDRQNIKPQTDQLRPLLTPRRSRLPEIKDDGPHVRDSFAEFAGILWQHILRVKREYRQIAPPPELRHGRLMQSVNETVDDSVFDLVQSTGKEDVAYLPPNLWEYCKRHYNECGSAPTHTYARGFGLVYLVLWITGIFFGGYALGELIDRLGLSNLGNGPLSWFWSLGYTLGEVIDTLALHKPKDRALAWSLAAAVSLFSVFVDWRESVLNHQVALEPNGPRAERRMALGELCLVWRLVALVLFVLGAGAVCIFAWRCPWLWRSPSWDVGWLLAFGALWLCFLAAKSWCAVPMNDAGLGSIVKLQLKMKSENVLSYLVDRSAGHRNAMGRNLLAPVARTIWRDIFGFIPIYSLLIFIGSWAALSWLEPGEKLVGLLSTGWPLTVAVILAVACAVADWMEDAIHLQYLKTFPNEPSQILVWLATGLTWVKFLLFGIGILATTGVTLWLAQREIWLTLTLSQSGSALGLFSAALALLVLLSAVIESRSVNGKKGSAEEVRETVREAG